MHKKLLITGSIAFDEIMNFPGSFGDHIKSDKIHQLNVSFVVDKLEKQIGGTATNIAYNSQLLLGKHVYIASAVGEDGDIFYDWLHTQGISDEYVKTIRGEFTATGKAITDQNDNQIWGFYYGASKDSHTIDLSSILNKNTLLVISANHMDSFLKVQNDAIKSSIDYVYDPGMVLTAISDEDLKTGTLHAKWLVGNDYEIAKLLERIKVSEKELVNKGIVVITTLGAKGVRYMDSKETFTLPGFKPKRVVDPTGAGDAWRGGFLAGILSGKDVKQACAQGNAIASFAVERYGTVNHSPSSSDLEERTRHILSSL